jgi:two-component system, LytTR family, response regulator
MNKADLPADATLQNNALVVACCSKKHFYYLSEVIRLEAKSNYTVIYAVGQPPLTVAKVLADYEALLAPFGFLRVHRSCLINRQHIQGMDGNGNLVMMDAAKIDVSRRRKKEVRESLRHHKKGSASKDWSCR